MAGFYFGTSRWDDLPAALGLQVEEGYLRGSWGGVRVQASFGNQYDHQRGTYDYYTWLRASFDPPLLLGSGVVRGLDPEHRALVLDARVLAELQASVAAAAQLSDYALQDGCVSGTWWRYEESAARYRAAFEALTHVVKVVAARRAAHPARWEGALQAHWGGVVKAWGLSVDPPRYRFWGKVQGRDVVVSPAIEHDPVSKTGLFTTQVQIQVGLPPGMALSLSRQNGDGFFRRLFRGQDVIVGDAAFDAAFVVKGEPESFVRSALGPRVRAQINALRAGGYEVTLHDGVLDVFAPGFTSTGPELDALLKQAFSAAAAFGAG
jgi:hypothetical protein